MELISTTEHLSGIEAGEFLPCVGVDFEPLGSTPFGKLVRVYVHANYPATFCLKSFASLLSSHEPLIVGDMEFVTILEHGAKTDEVLGFVPGHTDNLNLHNENPNVKLRGSPLLGCPSRMMGWA